MKNAGIITALGSALGKSEEEHIRTSYTALREKLEEVLNNIERVDGALSYINSKSFRVFLQFVK